MCGGVCTYRIAKQVYTPWARRLGLMWLYSTHLFQYLLNDKMFSSVVSFLCFVCVYVYTHLCGVYIPLYTERESSIFPLCFPSTSLLLWNDCWFWGNSNHQLLSPYIMIYNLCTEIVHYRKSKRQASLSLLNSWVLICRHHTGVMMEVRNICCLDISAPQKQGGKKTQRDRCQPVDIVVTQLTMPPREHIGPFSVKEIAIFSQLYKASFGHSRVANDQLWQRNGLPVFHPSLYSTAIDPSVYFHTIMDGIVPPFLLLVQIIMNQYVLKAPHQNIILTHDL